MTVSGSCGSEPCQGSLANVLQEARDVARPAARPRSPPPPSDGIAARRNCRNGVLASNLNAGEVEALESMIAQPVLCSQLFGRLVTINRSAALALPATQKDSGPASDLIPLSSAQWCGQAHGRALPLSPSRANHNVDQHA